MNLTASCGFLKSSFNVNQIKTHKWSSSLLTVVLKLVNENAGSEESKQNVNTVETSSDASTVN